MGKLVRSMMAKPRVGALLVLATALVCSQAERSSGDPLSVQDLSAQHASEELQDQQTVQQQQQEGIDTLNELHLAAQEIQFDNEARTEADSANAKKSRTERTASAEEQSKVSIAQEKFTQAMANAKVSFTRSNNLVKERANREKLDIIKRKQEQLIDNVRQWKAQTDQEREITNQAYHRAEARFNRELAAAEQIRAHGIETVNANSEAEMKKAADAADAQQDAIKKNLASALAKNLRDKAEYIQNGGPELPVVTLLQESPEEVDSVLSAGFAKDKLQAEEEAARVKAEGDKASAEEEDAELVRMKAEQEADSNEASAFHAAEQAKQQQRDAANKAVEQVTSTAQTTLKAAKAQAEQQFETARADAVLSAVNEKKAVSQQKAKAYSLADHQEQLAIQHEKARFNAGSKMIEKTREATIRRAKRLLDKKLESIDTEEEAETTHATQTMERTIAQAERRAQRAKKESLDTLQAQNSIPVGSLSLLEVEPEGGLYDLDPSDKYMRMSAEEIVHHNKEQSAADEQTVQQSIARFEKEANEASEREKLEAAKAQEADEEQLLESQTRKNSQAAETFAQQAMARAKMAHAAEQDRIANQAKAREQKIESKATAEKLEETQRKETLYNEATKEWQLANKRAREEELATFKKIEAEQEKELAAAHQEKESTLKAAAADRDAKKAEATKAKNEEIADAEKQKSAAITAAANAKSAVMKQLELKMAEEPEAEVEVEATAADEAEEESSAPEETDDMEVDANDDPDELEQPDPIE